MRLGGFVRSGLWLGLLAGIASAADGVGPAPTIPDPLNDRQAEVFSNFKLSLESLETLEGEAVLDASDPTHPPTSGVTSRIRFVFAKPFRVWIDDETNQTRVSYDGRTAWLRFLDRGEAARFRIASGSDEVQDFFGLFSFESFVSGILFADILGHFEIAVTLGEDVHEVVLTLRPSSVYAWGLGLHRIDVSLDPESNLPRSLTLWTLEPTGGDPSSPEPTRLCRIRILEIRYNAPVEPGLFSHDPEPGTKLLNAMDVLLLFVEDALARSAQKAMSLMDRLQERFETYLRSPWEAR